MRPDQTHHLEDKEQQRAQPSRGSCRCEEQQLIGRRRDWRRAMRWLKFLNPLFLCGAGLAIAAASFMSGMDWVSDLLNER
jgi:hypothetical protein